MQPEVVKALSIAVSKVYISFDGWTTKGSKRGYLSVVAHFANASRVIYNLLITLAQLASAHTGEVIAKAISETLEIYSITRDRLGYFVLNNSTNNNTAIAALSKAYDFNPTHRRLLRYSAYTLNLVG
jgi:hypothetical protein